MKRLSLIALVVRDYDEAIAWYTKQLGFELVEDTPMAAGKRWVVVRPAEQTTGLLLAHAADGTQQARVGDQTGGRVFLFVHTDTFDADVDRMAAQGVRFLEAPRHEPYGRVVVFEDLYGNRWDLLEA